MRNLEASAQNRKQRLHIINKVLEPLTPLVPDNSQAFIDLTAGKLLREADAYRLPGHSIALVLKNVALKCTKYSKKCIFFIYRCLKIAKQCRSYSIQ